MSVPKAHVLGQKETSLRLPTETSMGKGSVGLTPSLTSLVLPHCLTLRGSGFWLLLADLSSGPLVFLSGKMLQHRHP